VIGRSLAQYRLTASIGAGGMGEVYRATDTKLDRAVAIKVLPAAFTADAERLGRFEREVKRPCVGCCDDIHVKVNGFEELQALPGDAR
jgi:serine/threonine protein kinase